MPFPLPAGTGPEKGGPVGAWVRVALPTPTCAALPPEHLPTLRPRAPALPPTPRPRGRLLTDVGITQVSSGRESENKQPTFGEECVI